MDKSTTYRVSSCQLRSRMVYPERKPEIEHASYEALRGGMLAIHDTAGLHLNGFGELN